MLSARRYCVYVLESLIDHRHYIGLSANIESRLKMHNTGKVRSTKSRRPFKLVFQELIGSLKEARTHEKYFKSAAGRKYLQNILSKIANDN